MDKEAQRNWLHDARERGVRSATVEYRKKTRLKQLFAGRYREEIIKSEERLVMLKELYGEDNATPKASYTVKVCNDGATEFHGNHRVIILIEGSAGWWVVEGVERPMAFPSRPEAVKEVGERIGAPIGLVE